MKALSIQQPYAELILQGRKTIELRTFNASYRGRFAIHASKEIKHDICRFYNINAGHLTTGAVVGTVELLDVQDLTQERYEMLREQHLRPSVWKPNLKAWYLANPERLTQPIITAGKQGWFHVNDELFALATIEAQLPDEHIDPDYDPTRPFELIVNVRDEKSYGLSIYQLPLKDTATEAKFKRVVTLSGVNLQAVADHVLEALRVSGYKATDLSPRRKAPFRLPEEVGVRLALIFLTVAPLSRLDRIEIISRELRSMPSEEAYYWYSKSTGKENSTRAQQALRVLLAAE